MTADLVAFLRARLDETEREEHSRYSAGEVYGKPCPHCGEHLTGYQQSFGKSETGLFPCGHVLAWEEFKLFAAVESRADRRVLADVQAKRALINAINEWQHDDPDDGGYYACPATRTEPLGDLGPESFGEENCTCGLLLRRSQLLRLLASVFADHVEFDPSWKW